MADLSGSNVKMNNCLFYKLILFLVDVGSMYIVKVIF